MPVKWWKENLGGLAHAPECKVARADRLPVACEKPAREGWPEQLPESTWLGC